MFNKASKRTRNNLYGGLSPKLIALVGYALAISEQDFVVTEGMRTVETQQEYYKRGVTQRDGITKKSNHQTGRAIDVYYTGWKNTDSSEDPRWNKVYEAFRTASNKLGIKIVIAGIEWKKFRDKPHIELAQSEDF